MLLNVNDSLSDVETFELIGVDGVTFSTNQCFYNKATKRVDILAECTSTTAIAGNVKFAGIPEKYIPSQAKVAGVAFKVNNTAGVASIGVYAYGSGNIAQSMTGGMTHLQFSLSYYC